MTLLIVLSLAALFYFSVSYYSVFRKGKTLSRSKLKKVKDALGLSTIQGKVHGKKEILSIYSRTKCVYYDFKLEYWKNSAKKTEWVQITSTKEYVPFYLNDETGNLLIDAAFADMDLYYNVRREVDSLKADPDVHQKLMLVKNLMKTDIPDNKMLRITETVIKAGDDLTVVAEIKERKTNEELDDMSEGIKNLAESIESKETKSSGSLTFKTAAKIEGETNFILSDSSPKELSQATDKSKLVNLIGTIISLAAAIVFIVLSKR